MNILKTAALAGLTLLAIAGSAQAGGDGGGNDRLTEASSAYQGTAIRSRAIGHGYREVTTTRDGQTTTRRVGGHGERAAAAEWKDPNGNVVRWNPRRAKQPDFAETDYRGEKIRSEADGKGGRNVTRTRGGKTETKPSRFDRSTWAEVTDPDGRTFRWEPGNKLRRVEGGNK